jgi:murein DD-endopeptidase MepM/ murein hydrolase activator NlpD
MTLMLMSPKHERPRKIRFPALVGKAAVALLIIVIAALGWLIVERASLVAARSDLRARNARLLRENERLAALEGEVVRLSRIAYLLQNVAAGEGAADTEQWLAEVRGLLGVEQNDSTVAAPSGAPVPAAERIPHRWPVEGPVTAEFQGQHLGIDIAAPRGTAVRAAAAGRVAEARTDSLLGFLVKIDHANGYVTTYGHNSHFVVVPGQEVRSGEVIAFVGSSGRASGPHLHYEVARDGEYLDPRGFLPGTP